jgi:hypothetical protein
MTHRGLNCEKSRECRVVSFAVKQRFASVYSHRSLVLIDSNSGAAELSWIRFFSFSGSFLQFLLLVRSRNLVREAFCWLESTCHLPGTTRSLAPPCGEKSSTGRSITHSIISNTDSTRQFIPKKAKLLRRVVVAYKY